MSDEQASEGASFLTDKISLPGDNDRFCDLDRQENDLFAARKGIMSDWARNAPLLHLNYRDTRTVMIQNAHGIATNDTSSLDRLLLPPFQRDTYPDREFSSPLRRALQHMLLTSSGLVGQDMRHLDKL